MLSSLEYADDILLTLTEDGLQNMLDYIVSTSEPFGLRFSAKKCELICFHRPVTVDKSLLPKVTATDTSSNGKNLLFTLAAAFPKMAALPLQ